MSVPRWVAVDDADSIIQYTGSGWFQDQGSQNDKGNFGASYQSTLHGTQTNASLTFAFSGTQVRVYGFNDIRNDSGIIDPSWECFVDNISIGQSNPSIAVNNYWILCDHHQLLDGPHVITVNATVMKAQTFWFDQIQYVPSSYVPLDNAAVVVDNPDSAITYGDGWGNLANFCNVTNTANSTMAFLFNGVSVSWYAFIPESPHTPTTGSYSVDGRPPADFLLKGIPTDSDVKIEYNQKLFETPQYESGPHELVVTYLGNSSTTPLTLDWLVVQNGTSTSKGNSDSNQGNLDGKTGSSHSKNVGLIIGGVIGSLVLISIAIAAYFYFFRPNKNQKQKRMAEEEAQLEVDRGSTIEPFHLSPSIQTGSFYASHRPQGSVGTLNTTLHGSKPSQTTSELRSLMPPSTTSRSRSPAPDSASGQLRPSPSNDDHLQASHSASLPSLNNTSPPASTPQLAVVAEKQRQEAEATAAALRPQRLPVPPPTDLQVAGSDSGSSRMIVHEDSGLRLPRASQGSVVEVPPMYTAG